MQKRVLIVGGSRLDRYGLRAAIEDETDLQVCGDADNADTAVDVMHRLRPDVVIYNTVHACKHVCRATRMLLRADPTVAILIVADEACPGCSHEAITAGARGVALKELGPDGIVSTLRGVASGYAVIPAEMVGRLSASCCRLRPEDADRLAELSRREHEVLCLMAEGCSNAEVARALHLSEGTVKCHVQRVLSKLNRRDRVQAVIFAFESGAMGSAGQAMADDDRRPLPPVSSIVAQRRP